MKILLVLAVCLTSLARSRNIFDFGQRQREVHHCEEFATFRDNLNSAIQGLSKDCKNVAAANQCVIPTVEILKQCLGANFVNCAMGIYEVSNRF